MASWDQEYEEDLCEICGIHYDVDSYGGCPVRHTDEQIREYEEQIRKYEEQLRRSDEILRTMRFKGKESDD